MAPLTVSHSRTQLAERTSMEIGAMINKQARKAAHEQTP
jgi:hypothetical protein